MVKGVSPGSSVAVPGEGLEGGSGGFPVTCVRQGRRIFIAQGIHPLGCVGVGTQRLKGGDGGRAVSTQQRLRILVAQLISPVGRIGVVQGAEGGNGGLPVG